MKSVKAVVVSIMLALGLSACGGGGGGTSGAASAPAPAATPKPTAAVQAYFPVNTVNVPINDIPAVTLTVTNAVSSDGSGVALQCNNQAVPVNSASSLSADKTTMTVSFPPKVPPMPASQGCVLSGDIVTTGPGGSTTTHISLSFATGSTSAVLHYTEKVYALWSGKYPYAITKTGATRVTNMTQYTSVSGSFDLFKCVIALPGSILPDGTIPVLCRAPQDGKYHELFIDPSTDRLYVFTGTLPAALSYTLSADSGTLTSIGPGWGDVQAFDPAHPTWGAFVQVSYGWYFVFANGATFDPNTGLITEALMLEDTAGNITVVDPGIGADTVTLLDVYSH